MRPRRPLPLVSGVLLAALLVVPAAAGSAQSLQEARAERAQLQSRLDATAAELGATEGRVATLEAEGEALEAEASELAASVAELQEGMQAQVVALYKRGSARDPLTIFLTSDDPNEALLRAQTLERVVIADLGEVESLGADRRRLEAVQERLEAQRADVAAAVAEQRELRDALQRDLQRAAELEQRLEAEERERQRRAEEERRRKAAAEAEARAAREAAAARTPSAPSAPSSGSSGSSGGGGRAPTSAGKACPVGQPHSFTDTWGAPRSGGRAHRGTDILAPYGTPVYAIVDGTWSIQSPGPSAGLWAILRGSDGNQYWYMHLQSHTVSNGARVSAGQQTATNGDTGNARGTPHVHFELHPGGGSAINPYPLLRSVC
ncbi:murein hydrolase activator EnvC family protein [Nitriliruptor alkaliphilus]|uniref:murein hydrolase activator EnvC family protein n=1 Tax=Nitriliruptor alkaliphilus TaxID=427918 RepID=UPI000695C75C|nr:M23 family metallopeptidase [Nitriliruptor alkaliphilus]